MRTITFQRVGGGVQVLATASTSKNMLCMDYVVGAEGRVQVVERPRAEHADVYYRKNLVQVIRFVVRRQLISLAAAHSFKHRHALEVNGVGLLKVTSGGRTTSVMQAANAVLT